MLYIGKALLESENYTEFETVLDSADLFLENRLPNLELSIMSWALSYQYHKQRGETDLALWYLEGRDTLRSYLFERNSELLKHDISTSAEVLPAFFLPVKNQNNRLKKQVEKLREDKEKMKSKYEAEIRSFLIIQDVSIAMLFSLFVLLIYFAYRYGNSASNQMKKTIVLSGNMIVQLGDIAYVTKQPNTNIVEYILFDKTIITESNTSLNKLELPSPLFERVHQSYVVNTMHIKSIIKRKYEILLKNGETIKYSRDYKDLILKIIKSKNSRLNAMKDIYEKKR